MDYQPLIQNSTGNIFGSTTVIVIVSVVVLVIIILLVRLLLRTSRASENLKYEFITIIAHKFRTPLTSTKWLIESLIADEQDQRKKESFLEIQTMTKKLIDLTGSLIEMTDADSTVKANYAFENLSACDITRLVANSLKNKFHEKNIFFSVKCPEESILINVDRPRMEFVLQTLMENACTYTSPGRNVSVTVSGDRRSAIIDVADDGIGIDATELPKIFSKFYRTEKAQQMDTEGFGVGLFLAKSVVRRYGGDIQVFSEGLGRGSAFRITLPRVR